MRTRFFLVVTAIVLLMGCPNDRQSGAEPAPTPTPGPAPGAVAPDASETELATVTCPSPELPTPQSDDTAIEPATYTVCDIGDPADSHKSDGAELSGLHLKVGDRVTICEQDEVMRVRFTRKDLPEQELDAGAFIVDGKARQLKALAFFKHDQGPGKHLVKITRDNEGYRPPLNEDADRCTKEANHIIRIQFCYFGETAADRSKKWRCPDGRSGAHQGDIHAQN